MRAIVERAREFRKEPTRSERLVWDAVRDRALGVRVYRQEPVGPFIPDFVCKRPRLIIEVDGPVHEEQKEYDMERQRYLEAKGYQVERISAYDAEHHLAPFLTRMRGLIANLRQQKIP
jgi:adenine-specific DNA-methyltransferase